METLNLPSDEASDPRHPATGNTTRNTANALTVEDTKSPPTPTTTPEVKSSPAEASAPVSVLAAVLAKRPTFLSTEHREMLEVESGISPAAIAARGAFTLAGDPNGQLLLRDLGFSPEQSRVGTSLVFPTHNWRGEVTGVIIRPDLPRTDSRSGKARKYEMAAGSTHSLDVAALTHQHLDDPQHDLLWTEGAKKADAAASHGLVAISLNGVYAFRGQNLKGGIANLGELDEIPFKGKINRADGNGDGSEGQLREIARLNLLVFDSDWEEKDGVYSALRRLGEAIERRGGQVKMVTLPPGLDGSKTGLDDFFARGGTVEQLYGLARDMVSDAERKQRQRNKARTEQRKRLEEAAQMAGVPLIETANRQLHDLVTEMAQALEQFNNQGNSQPHLFHSAGGLVHLVPNERGRIVIRAVSVEVMMDIASQAAHWVATSDRFGTIEVSPPRDLCSVFVQTPTNWRGIPRLDSVVEAPFFDAQGEFCEEGGYHAGAYVWLDWPEGMELPDTTPTPENVAAAKQLIFERILGEVCFANPASRAHALALMLLPMVRRMVPSATPLHILDAPTQSSGKSYAAELCFLPYGEPQAMDDHRDENEWAKSILATLVEGRTHMFFDNITSRLSSASLASFITTDSKSGRILGQTKTVTVSTMQTIWVGTSNNAQLSLDAASRALLIRLDTGMERPENKPYKSDPAAYIRANRPEVLGALATLVKLWLAEGRPLFTASKHRFVQWSRIMGGILQVAEVEGFLENLEDARDAMAIDAYIWQPFVELWFEKFGDRHITAQDLQALVPQCGALSELFSDKDKVPKRLGELLAKQRDKVFANLKINRDTVKTRRGILWFLEPQLGFSPDPQLGGSQSGDSHTDDEAHDGTSQEAHDDTTSDNAEDQREAAHGEDYEGEDSSARAAEAHSPFDVHWGDTAKEPDFDALYLEIMGSEFGEHGATEDGATENEATTNVLSGAPGAEQAEAGVEVEATGAAATGAAESVAESYSTKLAVETPAAHLTAGGDAIAVETAGEIGGDIQVDGGHIDEPHNGSKIADGGEVSDGRDNDSECEVGLA